MKLTGKKLLVLALALMMAMTVTVWADNTTPPADPVPVTGVELNKSAVELYAGEQSGKKAVKLVATVLPENASDKTVTWTSSDETVAVVSSTGNVTALKAGTATITAQAGGTGGPTADCDVTVKEDKIVSIGVASVEVDYGKYADAAAVAAVLADTEFTATWESTGTSKVKNITGWTCSNFDGKAPAAYVFTATYANVEAKANVTVKKATIVNDTLDPIALEKGTDEEDVTFPSTYEVVLNNGEKIDVSIGTTGAEFGTWAAINTANILDTDDTGTYTYEATLSSPAAKALYAAGTKLTLKFVVYDHEYDPSDLQFDAKGGTIKDAIDQIDAQLKLIWGNGIDEDEGFTIDEIDGIKANDNELGGTLYLTSDMEEEADTYDYDLSDAEELFYLPNGTGFDTIISYVAYTGEEDEYLEGTITLESEEFLMLRYNITSEDVLPFDVDDFEEILENWNDNYELTSVKFKNIPKSSSAGYLYVNYDEDDKSNTSAKTSTTYYVDPSSKQTGLDELTYVPGKSTSGLITIEFEAEAAKISGSGSKTREVEGYLQINVFQAADITVTAGKNQIVAFDVDWFEEFMEEEGGSKKNYEMSYIVFEDVPGGKSTGYLCVDDDTLRISEVESAKFYMDDEDPDDYDEDDDYAFADLGFKGGNSEDSVRGKFIIYGRKSSKSKPTKVCEGTIDFVTGTPTTTTLSGAIRASETMKFSANLKTIQELGGQKNVYVTFNAQPNGGKLVYGWGTASQEDVKIGTKYYLTTTAGQKTLGNVTFIPSYSETKVQKVIPINLKAYDAKDNAVNGTINLSVTYATYSTKFNDITTSTYADSVDFLANQNITTGMTANTFGPSNNVTRAQFVTFLYRAAGQPSVYGVTNKFTDVKSTGTYAYAYNAILWAVQNGITTGRSETKFDPAANVTHQELLTFLYRYDVNYLKHPGTVSSYVNFTDWSSVQSWAQTAVKWAAYKKIATGYSLQPATPGTRATVALWMHRMLTL